MVIRSILSLLLIVALASWGASSNAFQNACDANSASHVLPKNTACRGPFEVAQFEYNSRVSDPDGVSIDNVEVPVDLWGLVRYPEGFPNGPAPLILVLHGNEGVTACSNQGRACEHHEGFEYLIDHLASHGFIAVSVNASRLAGNFDRVLERGHLLLAHLQTWQQFNAGQAELAGEVFVDQVDLDRIGLAGHSRGGEAVVAAHSINQAGAIPFELGAIMSIAPTDKQGLNVLNVPHYALVPACDGDVLDSRGVRFFDRAFDAQETRPATKQIAYALGANHNFFNSFWGREGGGCLGITLLERDRQEQLAQQLATAFFRVHLLNEPSLNYAFTGDRVGPATPEVPLWLSYRDTVRLTIDDFSTHLDQNAIGGNNSSSGFESVHLCGPSTLNCSAALTNETNAIALKWRQQATYATQITPPHQNASTFTHLSLRVTQNPEDVVVDALNPTGHPIHFEVQLTDANGAFATVPTTNYGGAPFPIGAPVASSESGKLLRRAVMRTVRMPLEDFSGVDLENLSQIALKFSEPGSIYLAGLQFTR